MRREFSKKTKLEAFTRCKGKCEGCGSILRPGRFQYDHVKPAAFEGAATIENCRCLCAGCHTQKTGQSDIPAIAKTNRIRKREAGLKKKTGFRGWRNFKGEIVKRA